MKPFFLVETTTRDKLIHQGIFYRSKKSGKQALLWVHGLTSNFYGHIALFEEFAEACDDAGFGFAAFNNRGHDMVTGIRKIDKRKPKGYDHAIGGAGYEVFAESVHDIEAGIDFLVGQGYSKVVVIGESTGANKVCYYTATQKHPHFFGTILVSPISDRLTQEFDAYKLQTDLAYMQDRVNLGHGDVLQSGYSLFPLTPKRFLSLLSPNSLEDQFDYGDPRPQLTYFSQIKTPLLVIFGGNDEHADRSVQKIKKVFDEYAFSPNYKSVVIPDALHSYNGKEKELVETIVNWVNKL